MTEVSMNILNVSWAKPFTYVIPPKTEENYYYCVLLRKEPSLLHSLLDCDVTQPGVIVNLMYGLSYSVLVSVVNEVGKGLPAIADIIVPGQCSMLEWD